MEDVTRLVSSGDCLKIWDSTSMTVLEQFNPHSATHPVAQVCWSSSNQYLVSASSIGDKLVVSSLKSSPVPVMELGEGKKQTRVSLNSTSQFLVSGGLDNTVNIWDLKTKRLHRSLKDHKEEVTCVSFNGGDSYIASGSTSGEIILHSITTNLSSKPFGHGPNVVSLGLDYKGQRLSDVSSGKKDFEYLPHFAGGSSQRKTPLGTPGSRCYSPSVVQTPPPIKEEESITTPPQQTDVEKNNGLRQEYDVTSTPPAAQSTHVQSVNTYNTPEPGQRRDLPTQLTYDSPVSGAPPAAAPAPAAAVESGAEGRGAPLTSIQMNFVRNMIHEALEDFRDTCHRDIINLQVEMVRQFYVQLNEIHGLIEKYSVNDSLIEEIERLREENKRLRANY
ncbi:protein NEDD1-like [Sinocyclocheilus rhinocerous]|uniref:protein NEDD1-like n=1 Tax=Sinocyclocheilus rhinocerous TaxID=307959 RepID=UPI0007BA08BD|nr:PREDICTED: protein NEDD1-like [Sinocyclocheilus rhinocerous]